MQSPPLGADLEAAIERLPDAVLIADDERKYIYANPAACRLLGIDRSQLIGRTLGDFTVLEDDAVSGAWRAFLLSGVQTGSFRLRRPDGVVRDAEFSAVANIRPGIHISFLRDVTEQKRAVEALAESERLAKEAEAALCLSERRYRSVMEQSPLSMQVFAPTGETLSVNRAWCSLWGADAGQLRGYNILQDQQLIDRGLMVYVQRAFAGETQELPPVSYRPPSGIYQGQEIWVRAVMYPIKDDAGRVCEVVLIHENITEIERQQTERAAQADELARSNAELQRFAYVASHDLKEPMRNVTIFAQLLDRRYRTKLDSDAISYIDEIIRSAKRMSEMIAGLLEYSRIGLQRDLVLKEVDMRDLLSHALENLKLSIAQTGAAIDIGPLPRISCAPLEIVQLWQNLVGNAIKYGGDPPSIDISAEADHAEWIFAVRDQGIGIAPHLHQKIFELFKRLHARDYPGTGLGLTICKAIVERHHGRIWVESEEGKGATFRFTLPK
ncbi:MAG: PAS domain S-box protein [Acidobacteriaceae bacterium]|nr:PAS domain S-box protein [Acidobacteriaceae bacterium]MBV9501464.1 PAS domain S-box protein [Acidobacteriaceae bacterium]